MEIRLLCFFCVMMCTYSCSEPISYQESLADEIMGQYNKKMTMQEKMTPVGSGGAMMNGIEASFLHINAPESSA